MSGYSRSPRVQKGAIIGIDKFNPLASIVLFQYNPEDLTRTITARSSGGESNSNEALRLKGPPEETIKLTVHLDAVDRLETGDSVTADMGIHPQLASLEMLLYPKSAAVIANEVLQSAGVIEILPPEAPLALFIWGVRRVLPVRLTSFTVRESAFDQELNPIQAEVDLELRILTYDDLGLASPGGALFMGHQIIKEVMASIASTSNTT